MNYLKKLFTTIALITAVSITGCATVNDVVAAKETGKEGVIQEYDVTADQAWEIARTVFRWEGADAIEEHRSQGYMLTSSGMTLLTAGTVMGAWIEGGPPKTKVTVVTKRRMQTNFFTTLTEETFHKRFAQGVRIIKSGQPLPRVAPPAQ